MSNDEKITKLLEILKDELEWRNNILAHNKKPREEVYEAMPGKKFLEILELLSPAAEIPREKPQEATFTVFVNGQPVTSPPQAQQPKT